MISLRHYQQEAVDSVFKYWEQNSGNPVIVAPTGSGKSIICAALIIEAIKQYPAARILVLSHVLEIIKQDYGKLAQLWHAAPAGLYNAALRKKQGHFPIVFGTIQSVYKRPDALGMRHIVICDEAHMVQPGMAGMYGALFKALLEAHPHTKFVALTATDYRTSDGLLTEVDGNIFTDVVYEISIKDLLEDGYLTPPIGKGSLIQANMDGVKITAGEFNKAEMSKRFSPREFIESALKSDAVFFEGRAAIAIFCPSIEICDCVADVMTLNGIKCEAMHGENEDIENIGKLERFRRGELRALASVGMMDTGVDVPTIDCVVLLFATEAPGRYQQIIGRGFRPVYKSGYDLSTKEGRIDAIRNGTKPTFTVVDHGGNIDRHGPITHVQKPKKREKGERKKTEKAKCRICDICRSAWPLEVTVCGTCQNVMFVARDPTSNLEVEASHADIMGTPFARGEAAQWFEVDDVRYHRHQKEGSPNSLRVTYYSGIQTFPEWIHFERVGNMRQMAIRWWGTRTILPVPGSVSDALKSVDTLKRPLRVLVKKDGNYYKVMQYQFNEEKQTQREVAHG